MTVVKKTCVIKSFVLKKNKRKIKVLFWNEKYVKFLSGSWVMKVVISKTF